MDAPHSGHEGIRGAHEVDGLGGSVDAFKPLAERFAPDVDLRKMNAR